MNLKSKVRRVLLRHASTAPRTDYRNHDPVGLCRRYRFHGDREAVALISAILAFGKVEAFVPKVTALLELMGTSPRDYILSLNPGKDERFFKRFRCRLWTGDDIVYFLAHLQQILSRYSTLEDAFLDTDGVSDEGMPREEQPRRRHRSRLLQFARRFHCLDPFPWTGRKTSPPYYRNLVVDPSGGSACKRWNLFLRWVVRPDDGVDLGLWTRVRPNDLILPMDVHMGRITLQIGLRNRRTLDWKAAEEATTSLQVLDRDDPVRFDLPLCHLGISEGCRGRRVEKICRGCPIRSVCVCYTPGRLPKMLR